MKLLISDTADCVIRRKSDGHIFITAETQMSSLSGTLGVNEKIFAGIGNKPVAIMKGQKEITNTFRNAFYDKNLLSITQGVAIEEGSKEVYKREDGLVVTDNAGSLEVIITGAPIGATVYVRNAAGETEEATVATQSVAVPTGLAEAGELVSVTYKEEVTGDIITLDSEKFGEAFEIEYHTIGFDPSTNQVVKDIYIQLDHAVPSGEMELSFENGTAIAPEVTFDCLTPPNSKEMGRIIEVARV